MIADETKLLDYQIPLAWLAWGQLSKLHMTYLACEERVGKSYIAVYLWLKLLSECKDLPQRLLIITKIKAFNGWIKALNHFGVENTEYMLINPEKIARGVDGTPHNFSDTGVVIVDECHHAFGGFPKASITAKNAQKLIYHKPYVIFCSATPYAESPSQLFHQLNLSKHSPWDSFDNFYDWFRWFGRVRQVRIAGGMLINKYDDLPIEKIRNVIDDYFVFGSRSLCNFKHLPVDKLHYVTLGQDTTKMLNAVKSKGFYVSPDKTFHIGSDNKSGVLRSLHQIEGGTIKSGDRILLGNTEKIDYILTNFGDKENIGIFYEYQNEKLLLEKYFQNAKLFQSSSHAEGVDLSHLDEIIVYSMNFSAAKYLQRRARQCNISRDKPIIVNYLICKRCISEYVYDSVANKGKTFVYSSYLKYEKEIRYGI